MVPVTALLLRGEPGGLVLGYSLIGLALGTLVPSTFLAELFPTRLRYSGLSLTYGLGSALFGGTAPALAAFLVRRTGDALSPAWYATVLMVVAIACVLPAPKTVGRPLDRLRDVGGDVADRQASAEQNLDSALPHPADQLGKQARLSHPCITGQQHDARPTLLGALNGGKESAELLGATYEP
jgi:MFS family permease